MLLRQGQQRKRSAFTLMEIIVVVAIILILASAAVVVVPRFLEDAYVNRAKMDVKTIEKAAMTFKINNGRYPTSVHELAQPQQDGRAAFGHREVDPVAFFACRFDRRNDQRFACPGQNCAANYNQVKAFFGAKRFANVLATAFYTA